ncbi:MAG: DNA polymerase Y family protein [Propioniciclava sp.]|uniref:DNA polymerase Y family protein n=1 Tax=Propioniciclava sp. TaxID=2038686 RepID=UPI0039E381F6
MSGAARRLVVWFPEWAVTAWARTKGGEGAASGSVAIMDAGRVVACSEAAAAEGVSAGQRKREAQGCCPELLTVPADPDRDGRVFAGVLDHLEQLTPGFQCVRPGSGAVPARGIARYYGGEHEAAQVLLNGVAGLGIERVTVGIADDLFTAEQAAQRASSRTLVGAAATPRQAGGIESALPNQSSAFQAGSIRIVPPGEASAFLAPLPVTCLQDEALTTLLHRLGVRTLGAFAALDVARVRARLGEHGVRLHALASGRDERMHAARTPPPDLVRETAFEPPLELVDQVAFSIRTMADSFVSGLRAVQLVCTELRVGCTDEFGQISERVWLHTASFDAASVVDRVRWQLAAAEHLRGAIAQVRLEPVAVDAAAHHEPGLFHSGVDDRMHHTLSRLQAVLGHEGVVTPVLAGGRWLAERQVWVPWGERAASVTPRARPWPGAPPVPSPATVFGTRREVSVLDAAGQPVRVSERGEISAAPAVLAEGRKQTPIEAWAGPWPIAERIWDPERARVAYRFQVLDADQTAWLVVLERDVWWAEGRYD